MIRVFIADDHRLVRRGIRKILEEADDITVVGEAGSSRQVLAAIHKYQFEVLLLDISTPNSESLEILEELYRQKPDIKVLILTMYAEEQFAARTLRSHTYGYLTRESAPEELVAAVRMLARGRKYITPVLRELPVTDLDRAGRAAHEALSDREFQILRMLAAGKSPTEIGKELKLSVKTVSTYRARLMSKLRLKNTAEIIRYAIKHGLIE